MKDIWPLFEKPSEEDLKNLIEQSLVYRLRKRAEIRRKITTRKSVQENKPDKLADLLEEAANYIDWLEVGQFKKKESD